MTTYSVAIGKMETTDGLINEEREMLRFENLQWTTEPPTREGWYWVKRAEFDGAPYIVFVSNVENGVLWTIEINGGMEFSDFTHWLGPLPVPEPPSEGE